MAPNFEQLYSKIPSDAKEARWEVPVSHIDEAIAFLQERVPRAQYTVTESWSDDDTAFLKFTTGDISIKNSNIK